jgi:hypothetical protein
MRKLFQRRCCDTQPDESHASGCTGDCYRRTFTGDVAQCGCRWERRTSGPVLGDVLVECALHAAATRSTLSSVLREERPALTIIDEDEDVHSFDLSELGGEG